MAGWQDELAELLRELGVTLEEPRTLPRPKSKVTRNDTRRRLRARELDRGAFLDKFAATSESQTEAVGDRSQPDAPRSGRYCAPGHFVDAARRPG